MKSFNRSKKCALFSISRWCALAVLFLAISSCLPDPLDLDDIPELKPEIVVAAQLLPEEGLVVFLSKTFGALEANDNSDAEALLNQIAINDAVVVLEGPGGTDTLQFIENGFYGGIPISLIEGDTYNLYVSSESWGEVSASTVVQSRVLFDEIDAELYYNEYDDTLAYITYALNDPLEKNWYMINVQSVELESFAENLINPRTYTYLFYDSIFNGENYVDQFLVFSRDYQPGDTIAVSLANIGKPYYDFMKLRMDNRFNFIEFVSEPVNYPSNVVGGKGFFNLYIPDVRIFAFGEQEFMN